MALVRALAPQVTSAALLTWRPSSLEPCPGLADCSGDVDQDPLQAHFTEVSPKTSCSKPAGVPAAWWCRFSVPDPSELPSEVSVERCRGTQAWDSMPSTAGDRSWQPCQAQQKVASGCRDAWRGACGELAAPHEHLELFLDFPLSKSGLGSGRKW